MLNLKNRPLYPTFAKGLSGRASKTGQTRQISVTSRGNVRDLRPDDLHLPECPKIPHYLNWIKDRMVGAYTPDYASKDNRQSGI